MSNIPTPKEIPPTPQQVDRTLQSAIAAAQSLISSNPRHFANLRASFLALYTHPTFQLILGIPSQVAPAPSPPSNQLQTELTAIKSTITALTKSIADLQPKVKEAKASLSQPPPPAGNPKAQGKGLSHVTTPMYASKAASKPRPSLVLDTEAINPDDQFDTSLCDSLNGYMHEIGRNEVKFSATRYNKKGNLVLTAHHTTTQSQLNSIAEELKNHIEQMADNSTSLLVSRQTEAPSPPRSVIAPSLLTIPRTQPLQLHKNLAGSAHPPLSKPTPTPPSLWHSRTRMVAHAALSSPASSYTLARRPR
jgi:chaperonin cofactor prefoldin